MHREPVAWRNRGAGRCMYDRGVKQRREIERERHAHAKHTRWWMASTVCVRLTTVDYKYSGTITVALNCKYPCTPRGDLLVCRDRERGELVGGV